jgi:glycogen operon protein
MEDHDWEAGYARSLGVFLNGGAISEPGRRGEKVTDDSFLLLFNAHYEDLEFRIPQESFGPGWSTVLDTAVNGEEEEDGQVVRPGDAVTVCARSVRVLIAGE